MDAQQFAQVVVEKHVNSLRSQGASDGSAVVIDPKTGEVMVLVGSVDWFNDQFGKVDVATSLRQPGSSFKPIIYAAAFEKGIITPATILKDNPITYQLAGSEPYKPTNFDNRFRGNVSVRKALSNLLVELIELTNAYAVFANEGKKNDITTILEVDDKQGHALYTYTPKPTQVIQPEYAFLISSILSDSNARKEVFGNNLNISRVAAVKTGTSENFRDSLILTKYPIENFNPPDRITSLAICPGQGLRLKEASSAAFKEYFVTGTEPQGFCQTERKIIIKGAENSPLVLQ